jgi:uncharacterized alkaline shock family protein YloU
MKNTLKTAIDGSAGLIDARNDDKSAIAHLGIAPGVIETMVAHAASEVPGVAAVGGPRVDKRFNTVLTRTDDQGGVGILAENGHIVLDISIQIFYGYKLQDIVDGIKVNVSDALESQAGISVDAINVYVSALQFEE